MTYKAITLHVLAFGGVTGSARLTEAVKQSSLDIDAVYWNYTDTPLSTHITAWRKYTGVYDGRALLYVSIDRLQPVTDDEA
jgi:hypothetical protein